MSSARITEPRPTAGKAPSHSPPDMRYAPGIRMAKAMGWFSIGLGLAQVLAPRAMARITGLGCAQTMMLFGVREIASGVGILRSQQPAGWMWARVAGDAMDLAALGGAYMRAYEEGDEDREHAVLASTTAVAGATAVDVIAATQLTAAKRLEG